MLARWFGFRVDRNEIEIVDGDTLRYRPNGWSDGQQDGTRNIRLTGRNAPFDAPELGGRAKSEREALWGAASKRFLEERIERASRLKLKPTGRRTPRHDEELMVLLVDGQDVAEIMMDARMAWEYPRNADGTLRRPDWEDLWDQRPDVLRR